MTADLDALLDANPPEPEPARSTATPRRCRRHEWELMAFDTRHGDAPHRCCARCGTVRDEAASRRGRQSRNYGNRAELKVARAYGGTKVGHHGGPVDVRGRDFDTQVRTKRRMPPSEWTTALNAMTGGPRCPRMLLRFVVPGGQAPMDFFVFRASDFLAWFGRDDATDEVESGAPSTAVPS